MNAEFIKYLKGWSEREAAMATPEDMELWCTTQGLGIECDDVEIREEVSMYCKNCGYSKFAHGAISSICPNGKTFFEEFPANTPVQEEGVVVPPAGSRSHSLKSVPVAEQGSKRDRGEQPLVSGSRTPKSQVSLPSTACEWLREQGIFMDAGDL